MGRLMSGEVSDTILYNYVEEPWAANRDVQLAHGVEFYGRYRDDVLIIARRGAALRTFFHGMSKRARGVYTIAFDNPSCQSIDYLDVTLFKHKNHLDGDSVSYKPYRKPTAVHVPLHRGSGHNPSVHDSWPSGDLVASCFLIQQNNTCWIVGDIITWLTSSLPIFPHANSMTACVQCVRPGSVNMRFGWSCLFIHFCIARVTASNIKAC